MNKQVATQDARNAFFIKQLTKMAGEPTAFQAFAMMETYISTQEGPKLRTFDDMERPKSEGGDGEIGYQSGLENGYQQLITSINDPITPEWFINIHDALVMGITTPDLPDGIPKGFRDRTDGCEAMTLVDGETFSIAGVDALKIKKQDPRYDVHENHHDALENGDFDSFQSTTPTGEGINIMKNVTIVGHEPPPTLSAEELTLANALLGNEEKANQDTIIEQIKTQVTPSALGLSKLPQSFDISNIEAELRKPEHGINQRRLAQDFRKNISQLAFPESLKLTSKELRKEQTTKLFNLLYFNYRQDIETAKTLSGDEKTEAIYTAIATFCQDLDQLHLFVDGNIRSIGIFLVNKLLYDNELTPCTMKDVNALDALSIPELVVKIKEGQDEFQEFLYHTSS